MIKNKLFWALFCFLFFADVGLSVESKVVAVVDGNAITNIDLQRRFNLIVQTSQLSHDKQTLDMVRKQVLQLLIDEQLIVHEAKRLKITVDPLEMQNVLGNIAKQAGVPLAKLREFITAQNLDYEQLESSLRHQVMRDKLHKALIYPTISVLDSEIEELQKNFSRHKRKLADNPNVISHVKLAEITILINDGNTEEVKKLLMQLSKEIKAGADFAKLAKEFSQSANAEKGGEIGWLNVDQLDNDIAQILERMKPGQISAPIAMQDRVQIIKLLQIRTKKAAEAIQETPNKEQLREFIFSRKLDAKIRGYITKLRRRGGVVIN